MQSSGRKLGKSWAVLAVVIVLAFGVGLFVNSQLSLGKGNNVVVVGDNYPIGDCLGACPQHNYIFADDLVTASVFHDGSMVSSTTSPNLITNAGENTIIDRQMSCGATGAPSCAGPTNGADYIALTALASPTTALTDTTCFNGNEYVGGNGMNRALGTYTQISLVSPYKHEISVTFTYSGASPLTITGVCVFDAAAGGNLFAEDALASSATVSASGDTLTINWTFTH